MIKGKILAIDDDEGLQEVVGQYLEDDGYTVIPALNAQSALIEANKNEFDVILLDLVLPDSEGLTLLPQLQTKSKGGIIVVSGKDDTTEKIICLEMGADDYITKPFEMRELSARIKAVTRRIEPGNDEAANTNIDDLKISFGDGWLLDRAQFQLFDKQEQSVELTTGEFKLLEALILSANRALSREHLFDLTREGEFDAYDRAIDIQIGRIRKKLGQDEFIKTVRGVGYMFSDPHK